MVCRKCRWGGFSMFRIVSLLAASFFLNYFVMGMPMSTTPSFPKHGLVYGVGFSWMCCKVKEGEYPPLEQRLIRAHLEECSDTVECFHNPYYLLMYAAMTFAGVSNVQPVQFYAKSIGMSMDKAQVPGADVCDFVDDRTRWGDRGLRTCCVLASRCWGFMPCMLWGGLRRRPARLPWFVLHGCFPARTLLVSVFAGTAPLPEGKICAVRFGVRHLRFGD